MTRKGAELEKRFHRIARQLTHFDLQKLGPSDEPSLSLDTVVADLERHRGSSLFMGYYSHAGLVEVMERYGISRALKDKGFPDLHLKLDIQDPFRHMLQVYGGTEPGPDRLLIEMILHEAVVTPKVEPTDVQYDMLFIEWLCLQNPSAEFEAGKPRLPGQQKPGLGISLEIVELLRIMAERLKKDGLINIPRHYHNALVAMRRGFHFLNPGTEGMLHALARDLADYSLADASWAVEQEIVTPAGSSASLTWTGEEQVLPLSKRMKQRFASDNYEHAWRDAERSLAFEVKRGARAQHRADETDLSTQ
jgi:hypothetical protein